MSASQGFSYVHVYDRIKKYIERVTYTQAPERKVIMGGHWLELIIVILVGLALFGPKTLQSLGRNAGRGIGQAKEVKDKIMSELPMEDLHKISQNIPTSPQHAVRILMTPEQKERVKATEGANQTIQSPSDNKQS